MSRVEKTRRSFRPVAKPPGLKKSPSSSIAPSPSTSTSTSAHLLPSSTSASASLPQIIPNSSLSLSSPSTLPIHSISQHASQLSSSDSQPTLPATQPTIPLSQPPSRSPSSILPPTPSPIHPIPSTSPPTASQNPFPHPSQPASHPILSDHLPSVAPTPPEALVPSSPHHTLSRSSGPLFNPPSSPLSISEQNLLPPPSPPARSQTPLVSQSARESSVLSTASTAPGAGLSAAEKMKMKARAAKAARAAEKLRNPTPAHRSASVLSERPTLVAGDIRVPSPPVGLQSLTSHLSPPEPLIDDWPSQVPTPQIDPALESLSLAPDSVAKLVVPPVGPDIPVATGSEHLSRELAGPPKDHRPTRTKKPNKRAPKPAIIRVTDASPADGSRPSQDAHGAGSGAEEEDISPRLKRLWQLQQLREKKQKRARGELESPEEVVEQEDQDDESAERAATKRPRAKPRVRRQTAGKSKARGKRTRKGKQSGELEGAESEVSDPDAPLDPHTVSMHDLCLPERHKGKVSAVLQERMKRVIERRDREKAERMEARAEEKRRQIKPLARSHEESENLADGQAVEFEASSGEEVEKEGDGSKESEESAKAQEQAENAKKEMLERYGVEDLDSDDDMVDFEEVDFDEFASMATKKTKPTAVDQTKVKTKNKSRTNSKSTGVMATVVEEEEEDEEIEEVEFVVPEPTVFAPQLRVVDGQIVLDQDSLQVDRQDSSTRLDEMEIVEEDDSTRLVNSHTWGGKKFGSGRAERWSCEESSMFYDAIKLFGSDFEMIAQLFPGRTRRHIRAKWIKEEKLNPILLTEALMGQGQIKQKRGTSQRPNSEDGDDENNNNNDDDDGGGGGEEVVDSGFGQVRDFEEYAKIVGIDFNAPIPVDPMDKWREKERVEDQEAKKLMGSKDQLHLDRTVGVDGVDGENDDDIDIDDDDDGDQRWGEMELL